MKRETLPGLLYKWVVSAASIYVADWLLDGIVLTDFWGALWVAVLLGMFNVFLKPVMMIISLPFIVFTFGLFLLVINAVLLMLVSDLSDSIEVNGFWTAVLGSLIISLVTVILNPSSTRPGQNGGDGGVDIHIHFGNRRGEE